MLFKILLFSISLFEIHCGEYRRKLEFEQDFMFGVATSSYQVEGGWDADGKGENIWDRYIHDNANVIVDGTNGDVACNSYKYYMRDVEMLRELGVHFYRFSLSWARILPGGLSDQINEKGLEYYDELIHRLLINRIQPMITLYHFDLPQNLQDLGGWTNEKIVDWFEDYARVVFDRFANKIKYWITINQPNTICHNGYGDGNMAPAVKQKGTMEYTCAKNVLLAHARVWHLYDKEYRKKYKASGMGSGPGTIGISLATNWGDPLDSKNPEHEKTAETFRQFTIGLYANPIFSKEGDFPRVVKNVIAEKSKQQGYLTSRLPKLTSEEIKYIRGTADFYGMNHYTTVLVKKATESTCDVPSFDDDVGVQYSFGEQWDRAKSEWLKGAPYGLYKVSLWLNKMYNYPQIFITEHGWSTDVGLMDESRVETLRNYMDALLYAIEDGTKIKGYAYWSLMDNFEWIAGYSERFGLYEVDFDSENRTRTARKSALIYREIIKVRRIDHRWGPSSLDITRVEKPRVKFYDEL